MDAIVLLLALIVLAIPVAIVALLIGQSRLKARVMALEARLLALSQPSVSQPVPSQITVPDLPEPIPGPLEPEPDLPQPELPEPTAPSPSRTAALVHWMQRNWIYLVSAASLALAGVFLVQYSVQNGLLPPLARVIAAYLLGAALIASGEWLRRKRGDDESSDTAFLPSVFAGAGLVTLFAATVAARQLYGLIGPSPAFALLMITAALSVVLGWVYGPLLVAVGLIGAFAAPFLVGSGAGPTPLLYGYYALIAATGLAVDAVRRWRWLSVLALGLGYGGAALMMAGGAGHAGLVALLIVVPMLAIILPPLQIIPRHAGPTFVQTIRAAGGLGKPSFPVQLAAGSVALSSYGLMAMPGINATEAMLCFAALALLAAILLVWASKAPGLADLALIPSALFLFRLGLEPVQYWPLATEFFGQAIALRPPETTGPATATWLVGLATMISVLWAWRALGSASIVQGLAAALMAPVALAILELLWAPAAVIGPMAWALHAMGLAAAMVALTLRFAARDGDDHRRMAYATLSSLSLIALSLFVLTSAAALTLALAVLVVVAAWLDRRFNLPEMGLFLQAATAVLAFRLLIDPGLDWALQAPLFTTLIAFGSAIAAELMALRLIPRRPITKAVLESASLGLAAVLANILLTRWLVPTGTGSSLDLNYATTLQAMPWLVLALTQAYRARLGLRLIRLGLAAVAGLMASIGLAWSAIVLNPLFETYPEGAGAKVIGPWVIDTLALSYAMPALMLILAARRLGFPRPARLGLLAAGGALMVLYVGLEIRRMWQGDWLGAPGVLQYELYSYTVALILAGAGLLYLAIARRSVTLRRLAMAVIAVTVAKVFLLDAAGLTGLTRVFSFLGLGLSLAGLAWLNRWAGRAA